MKQNLKRIASAAMLVLLAANAVAGEQGKAPSQADKLTRAQMNQLVNEAVSLCLNLAKRDIAAVELREKLTALGFKVQPEEAGNTADANRKGKVLEIRGTRANAQVFSTVLGALPTVSADSLRFILPSSNLHAIAVAATAAVDSATADEKTIKRQELPHGTAYLYPNGKRLSVFTDAGALKIQIEHEEE